MGDISIKKNMFCDICDKEHVDIAVRLNDDGGGYEANWVLICEECLAKALEMIRCNKPT